jgi:DHA2 family multidrug resistance protein
MMDNFMAMMTASGMADPEGGAHKAIGMMLHRQASVLSFGDAFAFLALGCWIAVVLAFFVKPGKGFQTPPEAASH